MENLTIAQGAKTPAISFNYAEGRFEITGRSIPENSTEFYQPVYQWLDQYGQNPKPKTNLIIQLEYFNTSSSKCLLDIFRKVEKIHGTKSEVSITWLYEEDDEDMMEAGEDYQSIVKVPFIIEKAQQ